ncbi:hypothetical protein RFI_29543, partial [Reticulomyxa filosa]
MNKYLSIADACTALGYLISVLNCPGCVCAYWKKELYTLLTIYFPVASFLWTDCIGLYAYGAANQGKWMRNREKLFRIFSVVCWLTPLAIVVAIALIDSTVSNEPITFGGSSAGAWCWIQKFWFQFLGGKGVEWISYIFLFFIYVMTFRRLWEIQQFKEHAKKNRANDNAAVAHHTIRVDIANEDHDEIKEPKASSLPNGNESESESRSFNYAVKNDLFETTPFTQPVKKI